MSEILEITELMGNGLLESTPENEALFAECMATSVSITAMWDDVDNTPKYIQWDDELIKYLEQRAALIDHEGREKFLPFNLYDSLGLKWVNGYNYAQAIGDCSSHSSKNSLKASDLVNAKLTGRIPVEIHPSITYSYSRGNGRFSWGSGENLSNYLKYLAEMGNFSAADYGKYTGSKPKIPTAAQKANALKHQSIIIPLPDTKFETLWLLCSAGIGVSIGSSVYPTSAKIDKNGVGVPDRWSSGGHATGFCGALTISSTRYLWWENSHGNRYKVGKLGHPSGCFFTADDLNQIDSSLFRYGNWFGNVGEFWRIK